MASEKYQPQLILYRGWDSPGCYVWSPFVTKVEARLRFARLKYKADSGSVQKSPKGKIPYIEIKKTSGEVTTLSDSGLIVGRLVDEGLLDDLNARLSPVEKAHDLAIRALLEDKWYFFQVRIFNMVMQFRRC
jgi:glutathione S-transferase